MNVNAKEIVVWKNWRMLIVREREMEMEKKKKKKKVIKEAPNIGVVGMVDGAVDDVGAVVGIVDVVDVFDVVQVSADKNKKM